MNVLIKILPLFLLITWGVGCQAPTAIEQVYSDNRSFQINYNEYPDQKQEDRDACFVRVVLDDNQANYASPRTLLIEVDPNNIMADIILLFDLPEQEYLNIHEAIASYERVYFTMRVDSRGRQQGWAGPLLPENPRIQALLAKPKGLPNCFKKEHIAVDIHAFLKDMIAVHGERHWIDDLPFEVDWVEVAKHIHHLYRGEEARRDIRGTISIQDDWSWYWIPIVVVSEQGMFLNGSGYGGLTITLNHKTGRIGTLWIDPN